MEMDWACVVKILSLSVCCLVHLCWGSITTATYYVNAFKVQYGYTQSQVEMLLPAVCFGKVLSPIASAVFQSWGLRPTVLSGVLLCSGAFFLLWGSGFFLQVCSSYPGHIYICFIFLGFGSAFLNLSVLTVVTRHFSGNHQGKAVSAVTTCYAVSPLLTLLIYRKWFAHGLIEDDAGQDLHGFMLYSAVTTAILGCVFVGASMIPDGSDNSHVPLIEEAEDDKDKAATGFKDRVIQEVKALLDWPLQLLIWSFALTFCVICGIDYNLELYAKSSGNYAVFDKVFVVFHVTVFVARLAVGFISDAFVDRIPRTTYITIASFILALSLCLAAILPSGDVITYMLSITAGLAGGVVRPVLVTVLAESMGEERFAKNWGIAYCFTSIALLTWTGVFSSLFQADNSTEGGDCHGNHCLRWINVFSCAMMVISTGCSLALAVLRGY